jgi:hypothetical protein
MVSLSWVGWVVVCGQAALAMDANLGHIFFHVNKKYHLCKKYDVTVCIW